ncbi:hypothetical protein SUDANB15_07648 (plasmid) [Streptomyces sp. enrichment culture]
MPQHRKNRAERKHRASRKARKERIPDLMKIGVLLLQLAIVVDNHID